MLRPVRAARSALLVALAVTLHASLALAAPPLDSLSAQRAQTVRNYLKQIPIVAALRKNAPLDRAGEVSRAARDGDNRLTFAVREFKKIPARHKNHPDIVKLQQDIAKAEAYIADLKTMEQEHKRLAADQHAAAQEESRAEQAKERAATEAKEAQKAAERDAISQALSGFSKEYWKHKERIEWLKPMYEDPNHVAYYGDSTIDEAKAAFADLNTGCAGKHKQIADPAIEWNKQYRWWCEMAAQGDAMLKRMVENQLKSHVTLIAKSYTTQAANLPTCKGKLKDWDQEYYFDSAKVKKELITRYTPDFAKVGATISDDLFAEADAALAALLPQIAAQMAAAPADWKWDPYGKPASDSFVKSSYQKAYKGAKILKIHKNGGWNVYKNNYGVNQYRTQKGDILFQIKGEPWCRWDSYYYVQDAKGRSGWGKSYWENGVGGGKIVSCK